MEIALRQFTADVLVPDDAQYIEIVGDILENEAVQSMKNYVQHGATSCLSHCIAVSYLSYQTCLRYGLDARAAARAGRPDVPVDAAIVAILDETEATHG